jgi:lipopolysaccharide-induced tumor necrosis factor-alpha factor
MSHHHDPHHHGHHEQYNHYNGGLIKTHHAHPIQVECPSCHYNGLTKCETHNSTRAYVGCLLLSLIGCNLGCCLIPFCMEDCKNAEHHCNSCGKEVAYKRVGEH